MFKNIYSFFSRSGPAAESTDTPELMQPENQTIAIAELKSLGNALLDAGKASDAMSCYQQIIDITPQDGDAYVALGYAQLEANQLNAAEQSFLKALAIDAQLTDAHFFLGQLLLRQNLPRQALKSFKAALAIKPDFEFAWYELAQVHLRLANLEEALHAYTKAVGINPIFPDAEIARARVFVGLARWQDALDAADSILIRGYDPMASVYKAVALQRLNRSDEALLVIGAVLQLQPDSVEALHVKGTVLSGLGKNEEALSFYLRAIELNPKFASALSDVGVIYASRGDFDQALSFYVRAIAAQPDHPDALHNYCTALLHMGRCQDSLDMANQGLAHHPNHADMHWVKAAALLRSGKYEMGWTEYEWRWRAKLLGSGLVKPEYVQPMWTGQPIGGKTIWLQAEQGLGDTIQLLRYVPLLAQKGAKVLLTVQTPLISLCRALQEYCTLILPDEPAPSFDFYCPMFSLPRAFKTSLANVPANMPYLSCDVDLKRMWEAKLGHPTVPKIGLVWSGNPAFQNDAKRSVSLATLASRLPSTFKYVSLQKEVRSSDREVLAQRGIYDASADLHSFADTAALVACMDLVISVDTSVAHLAGALAKPVWIMLPYSPDWRWLMARDDSPWYPTARLFRQKIDLSWATVTTQIGFELSKMK